MKVINKKEDKFKVEEIHVINSKNEKGILYPNQVRRIIFEECDRTDEDLHDYELKRAGRLSLCFKTFINREAKETDIEICKWDEAFKSRYTIASFEPEYDANGWLESYKLNSCYDRLDDKHLNWSDFGELVQFGYQYLESLKKEDE